MAEQAPKRSNLSKVGKSLRRRAEKIKQKMSGGGGDDELFTVYKANFDQQQNDAKQLFKNGQQYVKALEGLLHATKAFNDSLIVACGDEWEGAGQANDHALDTAMYIDSYKETMDKEVMEQLKAYTDTFSEHKKRIEKRERRKLDYDRSKRALETAVQKGSKKAGELEQIHNKHQTEFNEQNNAICESLPFLYSGRSSYYAQLFQTYFDASKGFHESSSKSSGAFSALMEMTLTGETMRETEYMASKLTVAELIQSDGSDGDATQVTVDTASPPPRTNPPSTSTSPVPAAVGDLPEGCPSGVLRIQTATHPYAAADEDELELQPNDVVYVLTIPDPSDAEDGWLYGWSNKRLGLFPENFTTPA